MSSEPDPKPVSEESAEQERGANRPAKLALLAVGALVLLGALFRGCAALG
jgi:hypothetical protein